MKGNANKSSAKRPSPKEGNAVATSARRSSLLTGAAQTLSLLGEALNALPAGPSSVRAGRSFPLASTGNLPSPLTAIPGTTRVKEEISKITEAIEVSKKKRLQRRLREDEYRKLGGEEDIRGIVSPSEVRSLKDEESDASNSLSDDSKTRRKDTTQAGKAEETEETEETEQTEQTEEEELNRLLDALEHGLRPTKR